MIANPEGPTAAPNQGVGSQYGGSFRRPDGRLVPEVPAPATVPHDPVDGLRRRNEVERLEIHARTACPSWLGERLDVGWAIDVLHPRALASVGSPKEPDPEWGSE